MKVPPAVDIDRELGRRSLRAFIKMAWHLIEPARPYKSNWHIDALTDHLEAVTRGDIKRLVINVPPGSSKSLTCSVFWPAWVWTHTPYLRWITASYSGMIAKRDAIRGKSIMESTWYKQRWGDQWEPDHELWTNTMYRNSKNGIRMATTVGGSATGEHADIQLVDDPIKPLEAPGDRVDSSALETCLDWWKETMSTRMTDPLTARRVIIMQRLHVSDLAAHALDTGSYDHLCLPMQAEPRCIVNIDHRCSMQVNGKGDPSPPTALGFKDPRKEGELLWPERFPESVVKERRREMGPRAADSQDQQRPVPSGGGIFRREPITFWRVFPKGPTQFLQSWDCTFKDQNSADYVVGQVWARSGADYYLIDQVRAQMSVTATCRALLALSAKWPQTTLKLVEDKANGPAVVSLLSKQVSGLRAINPEGGKVARAHAVEPLWEAGNVLLPHPQIAPWVGDFIDEVTTFNGDPGRRDDQVDAMTQALVYLHKKTTATYRQAMKNVGAM